MHFTTGDMDLHRKANEHWIFNKALSYRKLDFIEVYDDLLLFWAEFGGFYAILIKKNPKNIKNL